MVDVRLGQPGHRLAWDPDYAVSAAFDPAGASAMARAAIALRPAPGPDGRMPDPRTRAGMPDLYHYAHLLGAAKRADPAEDVMSLLMRVRDDDGEWSASRSSRISSVLALRRRRQRDRATAYQAE